MTRYQVLWSWDPRDWMVQYRRLRRHETALGWIYRWTLVLGPLEVRRWA